jgi:SAM-dependent methyltransferase
MLETAAPAGTLAPAPVSELRLVPSCCPVCRRDEPEPVAVGHDFAHRVTNDSFLAVACPGCGLVYLSPQPAIEERVRVYPPAYFTPSAGDRSPGRVGPGSSAAVRWARQACRHLPPDARLLDVAYGPTLHLGQLRGTGSPTWTLEAITPHEALARVAREAGVVVRQGYLDELEDGVARYDVVLLLHSLEHCSSPADELRSIHRLLRPGGTLVILTENADSTVARAFRGRHWAGYDFPRHPSLFGPRSLRHLAGITGFEVVRIKTVAAAEVWLRSAALLLRDWASLTWLAPMASVAAPLLAGTAWMVEGACNRRESGARLGAVLRKPEIDPR